MSASASDLALPATGSGSGLPFVLHVVLVTCPAWLLVMSMYLQHWRGRGLPTFYDHKDWALPAHPVTSFPLSGCESERDDSLEPVCSSVRESA